VYCAWKILECATSKNNGFISFFMPLSLLMMMDPTLSSSTLEAAVKKKLD